jgi:hypothetical protein
MPPKGAKVSVGDARATLRIDETILSNIEYRNLRARVQSLMVHYNAVNLNSPNWLRLQQHIITADQQTSPYFSRFAALFHQRLTTRAGREWALAWNCWFQDCRDKLRASRISGGLAWPPPPLGNSFGTSPPPPSAALESPTTVRHATPGVASAVDEALYSESPVPRAFGGATPIRYVIIRPEVGRKEGNGRYSWHDGAMYGIGELRETDRTIEGLWRTIREGCPANRTPREFHGAMVDPFLEIDQLDAERRYRQLGAESTVPLRTSPQVSGWLMSCSYSPPVVQVILHANPATGGIDSPTPDGFGYMDPADFQMQELEAEQDGYISDEKPPPGGYPKFTVPTSVKGMIYRVDKVYRAERRFHRLGKRLQKRSERKKPRFTKAKDATMDMFVCFPHEACYRPGMTMEQHAEEKQLYLLLGRSAQKYREFRRVNPVEALPSLPQDDSRFEPEEDADSGDDRPSDREDDEDMDHWEPPATDTVPQPTMPGQLGTTGATLPNPSRKRACSPLTDLEKASPIVYGPDTEALQPARKKFRSKRGAVAVPDPEPAAEPESPVASSSDSDSDSAPASPASDPEDRPSTPPGRTPRPR